MRAAVNSGMFLLLAFLLGMLAWTMALPQTIPERGRQVHAWSKRLYRAHRYPAQHRAPTRIRMWLG
jgi:hypothetical protein